MMPSKAGNAIPLTLPEAPKIMTDRQTDVEDLTDKDVRGILDELVPSFDQPFTSRHTRNNLREIVSLLDRTGADWPHLILGLEPTP